MKKLRLDLDQLRIETLELRGGAEEDARVRGQGTDDTMIAACNHTYGTATGLCYTRQPGDPGCYDTWQSQCTSGCTFLGTCTE